ncbi:MAG: hypothetical protein NT164_02910 [Verrucomicrobiae bacterium]|nr:hypothetical protein [Verrucomicrobiae bacterium]
MKLPRDFSGKKLAAILCNHWDYRMVHQVGSHIILQANTPSHQRLPIPAHSFLRIGTLTRIFHTDLLRKPRRPMTAALDSGLSLDSMYTYSPALKSSSALPHQPSRLPRHDQYEISGLNAILRIVSNHKEVSKEEILETF